jgi:hypothetical protein
MTGRRPASACGATIDRGPAPNRPFSPTDPTQLFIVETAVAAAFSGTSLSAKHESAMQKASGSRGNKREGHFRDR